MSTRPFMNNTPNLYAGDHIRNKRNKEIYSGALSAVNAAINGKANAMKYEKFVFDNCGCIISAPNYSQLLNITRGWNQCSFDVNADIASGFYDKFHTWNMQYTEMDLSGLYVIADTSSNPNYTNTGGYIYNKAHSNLASLKYLAPAKLGSGFGIGDNSGAIINCCPTPFEAAAGVKIDPCGNLYHPSQILDISGFNSSDNAGCGEQYLSKIEIQPQYLKGSTPFKRQIQKLARNTDYRFSYPRKFNIRLSKGEFPPAPPVVASGGATTTVGSFKYHYFTTSGTFNVTGPGTVEYIIVGGGGGSGYAEWTPFIGTGNQQAATGGGGGGEAKSNSQTLPIGTYSITIANGGSGGGSVGVSGGDGGTTSFIGPFSVSAGGGKGSGYATGTTVAAAFSDGGESGGGGPGGAGLLDTGTPAPVASIGGSGGGGAGTIA